MNPDNFVEAIEEGRIIRVSEDYARREGLPILRKPIAHEPKPFIEKKQILPEKEKVNVLDTMQKKQSWKEKQVVSELIPNWQWHIRMARRKKGLSRRQLSQQINESEEDIRLLEMGCLPTEDFVFLNKIQQALGFNLRKDKRDFSQDLPALMKQTEQNKKTIYEKLKDEKEQERLRAKTGITGSDIEILEDEM